MPVVPFSQRPMAQTGGFVQAPKIDSTFLMMAAADLHAEGKLFEDRAQGTKDAIADGDFDPVGKNYTDFNKANKTRSTTTVVASNNQDDGQ